MAAPVRNSTEEGPFVSDGKWLRELRGDMPVVTAARQGLRARLTPVRDLLPPAIFQADDDPEHVHQLRVSTRRAGEALRIFAFCLPKKVYDKVRKQLRQVRRAAGAARDWDVFLEMLGQRRRKPPANRQPGNDFLIGLAQGRRLAAQEELVAATRTLDLDAIIKGTLDALKPPADKPTKYSLRELAVPMLTEQLRLLDQATKEDLRGLRQASSGADPRQALALFHGSVRKLLR